MKAQTIYLASLVVLAAGPLLLVGALGFFDGGKGE